MSSVVNRTMYPVQNSMNLISRMQSQFATLQSQLSTGQKASNLAELGSDRYFDLAIRARQTKLAGYATNITMVQSRLKMFDQVTTRLTDIQQSARGLITPSTYGSEDIVLGAVPAQAQANLDETINLLNSDINGRYLFGGGVTDKRPVATMSEILDGANGKAGFKQVANERLQADQGDDGLGRLDLGGTSPNVTLAEDGAHPFGFKLSTLTSSSTAVSLTGPSATAPKSLAVQFTGVPAAGDSIAIGLTLPDGTADGITLKAVTGTPGEGEFQIGADATATAANFKTALQSALAAKGQSTLKAASNNQAANEFFNGQGQTVQRVTGPDFAHATTLAAADPTTTVMWYTGGDSPDARASIQARVDDSQTINYGAQANESGTTDLVRGLAVLSIQNFVSGDPNTAAQFDAVASRNIDRNSAANNSNPGSLAMLSIELNNASVQMGDISSRHTDYSAQLDSMLAGIETVPDEQVAAQILALQTRLQATYQTTSLVSQLSLVNYIQ